MLSGNTSEAWSVHRHIPTDRCSTVLNFKLELFFQGHWFDFDIDGNIKAEPHPHFLFFCIYDRLLIAISCHIKPLSIDIGRISLIAHDIILIMQSTALQFSFL